LKAIQYRYLDDASDRHRGGLVVSDPIEHRHASLMFG